MQSRRLSHLEALANQVIGFVIGWALVYFVLPLIGIHSTATQALGSSMIFFIASYARHYAIRRAFNMYSKKDQTRKNKRVDPKKLDICVLRSFKDFIYDIAKGKCQVCKTADIEDYHHSLFGSFGADKDDRSLVGICRKCHHSIHHSRDSELGKANRYKCIDIGALNWRAYQGGGVR